MRRFAYIWSVLVVAALTWPALALAHDQPETKQSRWVMADWMIDTFFIFGGLAFVAFLAAWKAGHFQDLDRSGRCRCTWPRRTTTRPSGRTTKRSGPMGNA